MMTTITRWVLAHKGTVAIFWILVTVVGIASVGQATKAFSNTFSVPGREGYETNSAILQRFHQGGRNAPLLGVVTLPAGTSVSSAPVRAGLEQVQAKLRAALPGARIASFASTGSRTFVSGDGRTTFVLAYPRPDNQAFGANTRAAKRATAALAGDRVAGAPVYVTGVDALQNQTGGSGGPGVFLESLLGGLGALVVLAFVFASLLAFVPLVMAIVSIMSTFLILWGVGSVTAVSSIVEFLVALIGLGIAIDYSLLIVVRWREERAHGHDGDEAVVRAMATAGRAVVFSGTTVAIGLLAMIVLPLPFLRSIGYAGMLIPLISVIVATTLLPLVLVKLGNRLDWPHVRSDDQASRAWTRWARLVVRRRWFAALGALLVLAALVFAATGLKPGSADVNTLSKTGDAHTGLVALERSGIGPGALTPIEMLAPTSDAGHVAASLAAAWGVITLVWQQGHGSSLIWGIAATHSVDAWIPLMVFAFLFGLSMDYEVFILARMREEYDASGSTDAAVVRGIGRTGRLVTSAALILFLAFASMASAPDTTVKVFATALAAGIILDATVIRALLVPAVVSLFGRWNWWLPAWPARLLRVKPSLPRAASETSGD